MPSNPSPRARSLLLACTQLATFSGPKMPTSASGFFFQRGAQLFLVTCRHVLLNAADDHRPQRIEFVLHAAGAGPDATAPHVAAPV